MCRAAAPISKGLYLYLATVNADSHMVAITSNGWPCLNFSRCPIDTTGSYRLFAWHDTFYEVPAKWIFMKIISTRVHGVLDYLVGALLIASPWLFDFARGGAETWVPVILGASAVLYSLLTDYELGVAKKISIKTHLSLDAMSGVLLAISPWLFGFNEFVYLPHLILGILELAVVGMTNPSPAT